MEPKKNSHLSKALVLSLVIVLINIIGGFAHLMFSSWFKWISTIVLFLGIIFYCINYAKEQDGNVTFGNVFAFGFKISAVVACITVIYTLLSIYVIFPEMKDMIIDKARNDMEAKGTMSQDQIEYAIGFTKKFFMPFAIGGAIIGTLIVGAIAALIGAAAAKKNPDQITI